MGNLDPYLRATDLTELFEKKGKVDRIGIDNTVVSSLYDSD